MTANNHMTQEATIIKDMNKGIKNQLHIQKQGPVDLLNS